MQNFRFIIILMLLSMLALVGFQWYWIENALAVKREQFDRKVIDAMNSTVTKIERNEVMFLASQKMKEEEQKALTNLTQKPKSTVSKKNNISKPKPKITTEDKNLAQSKPKPEWTEDSMQVSVTYLPGQQALQSSDIYIDERMLMPENNLEFMRQMMRQQNQIFKELGFRDNFRDKNIENMIAVIDQEMNNIMIRRHNGRSELLPFVEFEIKEERNLSKKTARTTDSSTIEKKPKKTLAVVSSTSKPPKKQEESQKIINDKPEEESNTLLKSKNKAAIVKDVLKDFLQSDRTIYERLNQEMLDTLLKQELEDKGINIPFEYGIKDNSNIIFASYQMTNNPQLSKDAFSVKLFPNDVVAHNRQLQVYFPQKENFIRSNMWSVFGSSLLMILMIGGIFYSSVSTMLKQKKLSVIKNDFINNMTHEFKTPISTISLALEVMKDKQLDKNAEKYLHIIKDENSRLAGQVEKVLQMALLDKGQVKLNISEVDIHDIIEQVAQNLSVQIENKGGNLTKSLQAKEAIIQADEVHITNIFYNLLDNAIKYSKDNPEISIVTENGTDNSLIVKVKDKGLGMSKDQLAHIFEKFYRVPTGNVHDVKGFGLGLSYVKKMMNLHQADIHVDSTLNEGTEFELRFKNKRT